MKRRELSLAARFRLVPALIAALAVTSCGRAAEPKSATPDSAAKPASPLTEAAPTSASKNARMLVRQEVVPGKLWVAVYAHSETTKEGEIQLWTFASEGLWTHRQKEIRFSIKREPNEPENAFDRQLFDLYEVIYSMASKAELVDIHGRSILGGVPLLGRDDFHCIIYGPPQPIAGIEAHNPFISASIVTCDEERVGAEMGYARIFARLGFENRFFPTAYWTDRKRAPVVRPGEREQSIFSKIGGAHANGTSVRLVRNGLLTNQRSDGGFLPGDKIVLSVRPRGVDRLQQIATAKQSAAGIALLLEMDPTASTSLVWYPGQTHLSAITGPVGSGDRMTGNFLVLGGVSGAASASINEDGFVMLFPKSTWERVHEALVKGSPITIAGSDKVPEFVVEYVPATYDNPVDGRRYKSPEGWTEYAPDGGVKKSNGPAEMSRIVLLTAQDLIGERTNVKDLTGVIDAIKSVVEGQVGNSKGPGSELAIECELLPGKKKIFAMAQRPTLDRALMQAIYEKLEKITVPEVKDSVKFQVIFKLYGGLPSP